MVEMRLRPLTCLIGCFNRITVKKARINSSARKQQVKLVGRSVPISCFSRPTMPRNAGKITPRDIAESLAMYNQGVEKVQATIQGYTGLVEAFRVTPGGGFKSRMEAWKDACQYTSGLRNALQRHFKKVTVGEWFSDGAVLVPCTVADSVQRTWGRGNRQPHPKWDDVQWAVVEVMNPAEFSAESMSRPAAGDVDVSEQPESDSYSRASQDVESETSPTSGGVDNETAPSNPLSRVKEASASVSSVSPLVGIPFSPELYNFQSLRGDSPLLSLSSSKGRKVYDVDEELERLRQIKNMQTNNIIFPITPVTELNMQINAGTDSHVACNQVAQGAAVVILIGCAESCAGGDNGLRQKFFPHASGAGGLIEQAQARDQACSSHADGFQLPAPDLFQFPLVGSRRPRWEEDDSAGEDAAPKAMRSQ
eukprot:761802-Hanusia_phi.AAC.3